ncbi:DUF5796 family protein [Halapricum hydrolyticum]|uniref:DUF5796 family protein n=1 Tax=Halapricum hydrolyticum TaxID=2979991 RepID=A0AAE3IBS4_9EURY|nr:DUF5796 family protein [Halapricum hydrolyticum]MCU4718706.1 DUF5796 family protein [Halapricum hydrolyticum]MCU4727693.1 DUF5796 family protein [Halapricum hydrolyticum]
MNRASEVSPSTLPVELTEGGIGIEYLDGRQVFYHGVPSKTAESHRTTPQMDVHVLVTDQDGTEGILVYLNDRKTDGEILEDSGVGRVLLADGESTSVFPGVTVSRDGFAFEIDVDIDTVDGRVFVFEESEMAERRYEIVPAEKQQ